MLFHQQPSPKNRRSLMTPDDAAYPFRQEQLPRLHTVTRELEKTCRSQLRAYLDAMAPLFRPRRVLGNHMEGTGKEMVSGADQNFNDLRETYIRACGRPFNLKKELTTPLPSFPTQVQLHTWEYTYEVRSEGERRSITVVSPLTWVLAFPSTYTLAMLRQVVAGKQDQETDSVSAYVLRAALMHVLFAKLPEMSTLFE